MADIQTPWTAPSVPTKDLAGDLGLDRGKDPNITIDNPNGLDPIWDEKFVPEPGSGLETPNSVSGLPTLPQRFEPSGTPPPPPSLQDRNPGTIDQK